MVDFTDINDLVSQYQQARQAYRDYDATIGDVLARDEDATWLRLYRAMEQLGRMLRRYDIDPDRI